MAGSVIQWVRAGTVAQLACCASGDGSGDDANAEPLELAAAREAEQRAAAMLVGYEAVTFMHRPDGAVANDLALREQLVRLIRTFRPDVLAVPDPTVVFPRTGGIRHIDQRAAGFAGIDAIDPSARAMAFPHLLKSEGLAPHQVQRLLLYWPLQPDAIVDISSSLAGKIEALGAHQGWRPIGDHDAIANEVFSIVELTKPA